MGIDTARGLAVRGLERLARDSTDVAAFWSHATDVLRPVLPFDFHPCWFTVDPSTLLVTGHRNEGLDGTPPEIAQAWYVEADVNAPGDLVHQPGGATTVTAATHGDVRSSWRARHLLEPNGFDDSLDAVLVTGRTAWGAVSLLHTADARPFTPDDVAFVARVAPVLAAGTQLGLLRDPAAPDGRPRAPAVVVVGADLAVLSRTDGADGWLAELPDTGRWRPDRLPTPVQVVVLRALQDGDGVAAVTVRSAGGWVRVQGSRLAGTSPPQVAVIVGPAGTEDVLPLRLAGYHLTARERDVVELVVRGRSTKQIAASLFLSPWTVQDRLKSIFEKTGVRSRRELVALVHATEYQPRIAHNDDRQRSGRAPVR